MRSLYIATALTIVLTAFSGTSFAQWSNYEPIQPLAIDVTTGQTTILVFPAPVIGADRGNGNIVTKTLTGTQNVLRVKAAQADFSPTNLTVITNDGRLYAFTVDYKTRPMQLTYNLNVINREAIPAPVLIRPGMLNDAEVADYARLIASAKPFVNAPKNKAGKMTLTLKGVYVHQGVLFLQLQLRNKSTIAYDQDFSRFYIRDHKQIRRTAAMEKEISPLFFYQDSEGSIGGADKRTIVVAFEKFQISRGRDFMIELFERNGERHLSLRLSEKDIEQAKTIMPGVSLHTSDE